MSAGWIQTKISTATLLTHILTATLTALERGEVTLRQAEALCDAVAGLPDEDAVEVEAACVPFATGRDYTAFMRKVRREVLALDSRTVEERFRAVRIAQDWLNGIATGSRQVGPSVRVTLAASTLLGLDNQPGELDGHGPIPAALARAIAADPSGTWRRLITDDVGRLLDCGRSVYTPPKPLADFVRARDRECQFPVCHRQARHCELDHRQPWANGGHTNADNLDDLCPRHHHPGSKPSSNHLEVEGDSHGLPPDRLSA